MHTIAQKKKLLSMPEFEGEITVMPWSKWTGGKMPKAFVFNNSIFKIGKIGEIPFLGRIHKGYGFISCEAESEIFEINNDSMIISFSIVEHFRVNFTIPLKFIRINWIKYPGLNQSINN